MRTLPRDYERREALRNRYFDQALLLAHADAARVQRSPKCLGDLGGSPRHTGDPDGCSNDGSSCLCTCHDALPPSSIPVVAPALTSPG